MVRIRLLQAVCTVAILSAVPALAQNMTPPAAVGPSGALNPDENSPSALKAAAARHKARMSPSAHGKMAAATSDDSQQMGAPASDDSHATHHSAMTHPKGMLHHRTDPSQDAAVDTLNDQSYQAAQKGEGFGGRGTDAHSSDMMKQGGSGGMNDMSGGSMTGKGSTKP